MNPKWTTDKIKPNMVCYLDVVSFDIYIMAFYDMFEIMITPSSFFEIILILWNFAQRGLSIPMHEINAFY